MRIKEYEGAREQEKKKEVQKGEIKKKENDGLIKVRVKDRVRKQEKGERKAISVLFKKIKSRDSETVKNRRMGKRKGRQKKEKKIRGEKERF